MTTEQYPPAGEDGETTRSVGEDPWRVERSRKAERNPASNALPDFIRRRIEQAIHASANPKGMGVHDGTVRVHGADLAYMLKVIDGVTGPLDTEALVGKCPWCGETGVGFDEADRPSDYCGHDPALHGKPDEPVKFAWQHPLDKLRRCSLGCFDYGQCKATMHGKPGECASGVNLPDGAKR